MRPLRTSDRFLRLRRRGRTTVRFRRRDRTTARFRRRISAPARRRARTVRREVREAPSEFMTRRGS